MNQQVIPAGEENLPAQSSNLPANASHEERMFHALNSAIDRGMDADTISKMLDMQLRMLDRQNEVSFNRAMRLAQMKMPSVVAVSENTQTRSKYPKLEAITKVCAPIYFKHGFNCSFDTGDDAPEGEVRVLCYVSHKDGFTRKYHVDIPIDVMGPKGNPVKTATHGTISAVTYGQSRLMRMIWNVRVVDDPEDDDGVAAGTKPVARITEEQAADLRAFLEEVKVPESEFLKRQKCQSIEDLPASVLPLVISQLENRRKRMGSQA